MVFIFLIIGLTIYQFIDIMNCRIFKIICLFYIIRPRVSLLDTALEGHGYQPIFVPPPLKLSARIVSERRIQYGNEATQAGRDCHEVTAG